MDNVDSGAGGQAEHQNQYQQQQQQQQQSSYTPQTNNIIHSLNDLQLGLTESQKILNNTKKLSLENELSNLININNTVSNLFESVDQSSTSLKNFINHTEQSNELLNLYIKILSQNSYTLDLIKNNKSWKGINEHNYYYDMKAQKVHELSERLNHLKARKAERHRKKNNKTGSINTTTTSGATSINKITTKKR
ncbi:hypothetical protein PACTADRAFT_4309 [Pachysolen tannophilus NRRL Y-2460]|uniref:DASH complex subunit DUO1 n=1 Tax=Pachysolen tannophilus NRRL Y-2460 TaxID=669874 RepID=A0A1E4TRK8_PACTA|nr:hypothetical protein PACTADRAFT_4309 [Pachysolen tannophilus NRRL Y-2460]